MLAEGQETKRECSGGGSPGRFGVVGIDQSCECVRVCVFSISHSVIS